MTRRESAIISAFTGILCGPFDALHEYVEELMGRPVLTHEMGDGKITQRIKELAKPDFIALANSVAELEKEVRA